CRDHRGQTKEADALLAGILEREPRFGPALIERGRLAFRAGRQTDAEDFLRKGCALEPGDLPARYLLHQCPTRPGKDAEPRDELPRLKQAEDDLRRFQELSSGRLQEAPHDPDLQQELGAILMRSGSYDEGLRWLKQALKEDPRHKAAHESLAEYYQKIGDFGRA